MAAAALSISVTTTAKTRYATASRYRRQTEPLVAYYRDKDILAIVHGGGRMPDEVYADVETILARSREA
jgi:adenylate kinase family enzyme